MKNLILTIAVMLSLLNLTAQDIEVLETENIKLNDKVIYYEKLLNQCNAIDSLDTISSIKVFNADYTIKLISAVGNRSSQTVTIELLISHNLTNQFLYIDTDKHRGNVVYDDLGNEYLMNSKNIKHTIPFETPVKYKLTVNAVRPGTSRFSILLLNMKSIDINTTFFGKYDKTEIRNIPIVW